MFSGAKKMEFLYIIASAQMLTRIKVRNLEVFALKCQNRPKHTFNCGLQQSSCFLRRTKSWPKIWHLLHNVKSTVKISSIFVAFLENMNFTKAEKLFSKWRVKLPENNKNVTLIFGTLVYSSVCSREVKLRFIPFFPWLSPHLAQKVDDVLESHNLHCSSRLVKS